MSKKEKRDNFLDLGLATQTVLYLNALVQSGILRSEVFQDFAKNIADVVAEVSKNPPIKQYKVGLATQTFKDFGLHIDEKNFKSKTLIDVTQSGMSMQELIDRVAEVGFLPTILQPVRPEELSLFWSFNCSGVELIVTKKDDRGVTLTTEIPREIPKDMIEKATIGVWARFFWLGVEEIFAEEGAYIGSAMGFAGQFLTSEKTGLLEEKFKQKVVDNGRVIGVDSSEYKDFKVFLQAHIAHYLKAISEKTIEHSWQEYNFSITDVVRNLLQLGWAKGFFNQDEE